MDDDHAPPRRDEPGQPAAPAPRPDGGEPGIPDYFPGESDRTVPRSAWWVLGAAAVLLLVFVLVRPVLSGEADDGIAELDVPGNRHFSKTLAGLGHEDGIWLTDDSSSTSFLVSLPVDSKREQTRVRLSGTTQVAQESTMFLSVALDGQQVYDAELPSGRNRLDEAIDIPPQATRDGQVRVRVSTRGFLHTEVCTPERSAGTVIHLDPGTVVEASLSEPVHTVRDAAATWDRDLTVVLADQGDDWARAAADLGVALMRAGHDVTFAETLPGEGLSNTILVGPAGRLSEVAGWNGDSPEGESIALGTIDETPVLGVVEPGGALPADFLTSPAVSVGGDAQADARALTVVSEADPASLGALGADVSEIEITESHSWHVRYSLADLPGGRLPEAVRTVFRLPASPPDLQWMLTVSLNGRLIDSRPLDASGERVVALPPDAQLLHNDLTLTVQSDRDYGGCDVRPTSYPMQLLGTSGLVLSDEPGTGFTAVSSELSPGYDVYVPGGGTASRIETLNAVVPVVFAFSAPRYYPEYRWGVEPENDSPFVVVGQSPGVETTARIQDGRIVVGPATAPELDLAPLDVGTVIQCATGPQGDAGLSIQTIGGSGGALFPDLGRECVRVVTPGGSVTIDPGGAVISTEPPRSGAPR